MFPFFSLKKPFPLEESMLYSFIKITRIKAYNKSNETQESFRQDEPCPLWTSDQQSTKDWKLLKTEQVMMLLLPRNRKARSTQYLCCVEFLCSLFPNLSISTFLLSFFSWKKKTYKSSELSRRFTRKKQDVTLERCLSTYLMPWSSSTPEINNGRQ